jgi:hypothetical protein
LTPNSAIPPTAKREPLDAACQQVGRFLFYFAQVEIGIDAALAKLLELKEGPAEIVTANIEFNRKLNILQSVVEAQSAGNAATWKPEADTLISNIRSINSPPRQIVAHSPFEPGPEENSVRFKRVVARDKLRHEEPVWTEQTFKDHFTQMQKCTLQLKRLADDLKPYAGTYFFLGF